MSFSRRLRTRMFVSYLAVLGVGAAVMFGVGYLLTSSLFEGRLGRMGRGFGREASTQLHEALTDSLQIAFVVGLVAAVVVAGAVAAAFARRIVRPIEDVRVAADRMARGDYRQSISIPSEEELAALAGDINTLGAALDDTERRRTRLIGEIAHELRTPLTTIQAYMEGLIDEVIDPSPATFAVVAEEAVRLQRLSDDLTLLSQAEERSIPLTVETTDLDEVVTRAAERLRPQFDDRGVDLTVVGGPPVPVELDVDRMVQVLTNLLGNALTHTPAGGRVTIEWGTADGQVWLDVTDTGRGIDPSQLDHIFERFYRIPNPDHPAGRGIGLTIARSLARAHGGDLHASSDGPGTGATFRVTLPIAG